MTDQMTPDGQNPSGQQVNWEERFKGLQRELQPKYEAANKEVTRLQTELATKSSEIEQLRLQLGSAGGEKDRLVADLGQKLTEAQTQITQLSAQIVPLQQLDKRIKVAKSNGMEDLLPIIDLIPHSEDEEVLKATMTAFRSFGESKVKARETQLLAGVTPNVAPQKVAATPTTSDAWSKYALEPGLTQIEREKRFEAWREWGITQGNK